MEQTLPASPGPCAHSCLSHLFLPCEQKTGTARAALKKNPLRNLGALLKLNPYAKVARRAELLAAQKGEHALASSLPEAQSCAEQLLLAQLRLPHCSLSPSHSARPAPGGAAVCPGRPSNRSSYACLAQ